MESRTANLVLRLLQRHLPVPLPAPALKHAHSHLPGLLPRVPLSFPVANGSAVAAAGKRLLEAAARRQESGVGFSDVERNSFGAFFKQPNSPFLSLDRASDAARVSEGKVASAGGSGVEAPEPVWGFKLGLRLKSGMYMPAQHEEEEGWEASSVKRKRKKKMNKHKQRKLRRRDRHRN
ncbi:hypothetical protein M758_8G098300 [Ceratodon purpureus]|uniref:Small ribosomal subunit protein mS38 n=1 Tax=Ceratodon purpureus TaxID=3225 RepID=A0A8T0GX45_CERPU|nr:hypothetical protein KC19_8G102700 [Ceratodon purpureus]KAG0608343.1 hypothetical protein M758_8G098300 [Ceratodon purpureus]